MAGTDPRERDALEDFEVRSINLLNKTKRVYVAATVSAQSGCASQEILHCR
jgi:hypothetical protein